MARKTAYLLIVAAGAAQFVSAQPAPELTISKLEPNTAPLGASSLAVTVTGTGFRSDSGCPIIAPICGISCPRPTVLTVDGTELQTQVVSSTRLVAQFPDSLFRTSGNLSVRARNRIEILCEGSTSVQSNALPFTVAGAIDPPVSPPAIDFGSIGAGEPDVARTVTFRNLGNEPLNFSASFRLLKGRAPFIKISPTSTVIQPGRLLDVAITATSSLLEPGEYEGELQFRFQSLTGGPETVYTTRVAMSSEGVEIFFDLPSPVALTAVANAQSAKRTVTLGSLGGGGSEVQAVASTTTGGNWLKIEAVSATPNTPFLFRIFGDATNLQAGNYIGSVQGDTVSGNAPAVPKQLAVTFSVAAGDVNLNVTPSQVTCEIDPAPGLKAASPAVQIQSTQAAGSFTVTSATPWVQANPASGSIPAASIISCDPTQIPSLPATGLVTISPASGPAKTITVQAVASAAQRRTIPQIAYGGGFTTTITVVNVDSAPATVSLQFFQSDGAALTTTPSALPVAGNAATDNVTIQPGNAYTVQTTSQGNVPVVGWVEVVSNRKVSGFAVYRYQEGQTDQEAAVPMNAAFMSRFLLPFDNRPCTGASCAQFPASNFVTSAALANLSAANPAVISVTLRSLNGTALGTVPMPQIPAGGHSAFLLSQLFPASANTQGVADFSISSGQISAVGLRATPQLAFTSFEVQPPVSPGVMRRVFPQIADGGPLSTAITLVNTGTTPATASLRFYRSNGRDVRTTSPWNPPFAGNAQTENVLIQPGSIYTLETAGTNAVTSEGWAELITEGAVSGFAVYRLREGGKTQEAAVPLVVQGMQRFLLPFDNRLGFVTGMAMANMDATSAAALQVTVRSSSGAVLGNSTLTIPVSGHAAFALDDEFGSATANTTGVIEFVALSGQVSAMGLRFTPGAPSRAMTSFEALPF